MGSLHAFHSCNFLKMRPKSSRRIPLKRARLISTIGWRSKRAVGRRGRQKTLPFTGLIVSAVSGTSYTTAAWQTGWTARRKHRQMHAGLALQRLAFMRERKKHTRWNTEQKAFCVRWPPNGERSNRCTPAVHASTHVRTYVCTHHLWVTGSLVAPQPLYLDKLISRFKALSLKNSFHGFLIDARRSSVFCFQHGGKRLNGGAEEWVGRGGSTNPSSHYFSSTWGTRRCSPGRRGFFNPTSMVVALAWGGGGRACAASACSDTPAHVSALPRTLISDRLSQLLVTPDLTYHIILLSLLILFFETPISSSVLHYQRRSSNRPPFCF